MASIHRTNDEGVLAEAPGAPENPGSGKAGTGIDEEHLFGVHPNGIGQTLGGDLLRPNLGHDLPDDIEGEDDGA